MHIQQNLDDEVVKVALEKVSACDDSQVKSALENVIIDLPCNDQCSCYC